MNDWLVTLKGSLSNLATFSVYAVIVIIFIVACVKCLAPVMANTRALNLAIKAMKKDKGKTVRRKTWENEVFLGDGALQPSWRLYLENVFFADSHMQAPCNVEDYINEDSVINIPGRSSLGETVPSVFVSLGFLGTLIGLVISLATMNLSSFNEVSQSMLDMLRGLRYAFGTSIVGVIASITFTVINKTVQGHARNTLEEFTQIFQQDTDMPPVDPITQIATYQQEQTRALATIVNELQASLIGRIDEALNANIAPLAKSMENFMNVATFKQVEGVERIVNSFVSHMDQVLRGQFQNLAAVMDETCRSQKAANELMQSALKGFAAVSGDMTNVQKASQSVVEKFDAYLVSLGSAQAAQDKRNIQLTDQIELMQKAAHEQSRYINQLQDYMVKLQKGMESYSAQSEAFMKQFSEAANSSQLMLNDAGKALENGAKSLAATADEKVSSLESNLAKMLAGMDQALREVTEQLGWTIASIKESVEQLPKVVNDSAQSYAGEMARFVESVRRLQRALDAALGDAEQNYPQDYSRRRVE